MTKIRATERLRLDVERDLTAGELVNLVQNPSGDLGGWGWLTPLPGTTITTLFGMLRYLTAFGVNYFTTEDLPVTAGQYVAASWSANLTGDDREDETVAGLRHKVRLEFYDAGETLVSSSAQTALLAQGTFSYPTIQVPTGAITARLRFDIYGTTGSDTVGANLGFYFKDATVATAATEAELIPTRTNLLTNPSFETNTSGWESGGPGALTRQTGGVQGTYRARVAGDANSFYATLRTTGFIAITPGADHTLSAWAQSDTGWLPGDDVGFLLWYDDAGTFLGSSHAALQTAIPANARQRISVTAAPRGGATKAKVMFQASAGAAQYLYIDGAMLEKSSTLGTYIEGSVALGSLPALPPAYYVNIIGESANLQVEREELNLGTLNATVVAATLDPANTTLLRPGRRVRLLVRTSADDAATPVWEPVFTGKSQKASVEYRLLARDEQKRAVISLTAVDPLAALAQESRPDGVATIPELPFILEGAGIPWNVNGSGNQIATATVVANNDSASAVDQVAITRDTALGFAWVDRRGVLNVHDRDRLSSIVAATLAEPDYTTDFSIDYSTDRAINVVQVEAYEVNVATGDTATVTYPADGRGYRDEDSIRQWGAWSKTFTVQGMTEAQIEAFAAQVLAANKTPTRRVNYITLALDLEHIDRALLDLYDLVTVVNARAGLNEGLRIVGISHSIDASTKGTKWLMKLSFAGDDTVAPPQVIPQPSSAAAATNVPQHGTIAASGTNTFWSGSVTFPAPYAVPPGIQLTAVFGGSSALPFVEWNLVAVTETGFTWQARWSDGASRASAGQAIWTATP